MYYNSLRTDRSLSGLCQLTIDTFLPDILQKYLVANVKCSSEFKLYESTIPSYLHNRPTAFIKHCMQRIYAAKLDFNLEHIIQLAPTRFQVKSKVGRSSTTTMEESWYDIQFGNEKVFPMCECMDFKYHYLPCKHFFAIFLLIPGYSWYSLPSYFRDSPFISIDTAALSMTGKKYELTYHITNSDNPKQYLEKSHTSTSYAMPQVTDSDVSILPCLNSQYCLKLQITLNQH